MSTKTIITVLSFSTCLLSGLCIWLVYTLVDASISYTYLESSVDSGGRQIKLMRNLLETEFVGQSEVVVYDKLLQQVNNSKGDLILKREGGNIVFETLEFQIEDGVVTKLH